MKSWFRAAILLALLSPSIGLSCYRENILGYAMPLGQQEYQLVGRYVAFYGEPGVSRISGGFFPVTGKVVDTNYTAGVVQYRVYLGTDDHGAEVFDTISIDNPHSAEYLKERRYLPYGNDHL